MALRVIRVKPALLNFYHVGKGAVPHCENEAELKEPRSLDRKVKSNHERYGKRNGHQTSIVDDL